MRYLLAVAIIFLTGCELFTHERPTPLVARVETAGAGPLAGVTREAMHGWLAQHQPVASEVARECRALRARATAEWNESTEGRLCAAASETNFFALAEPVGDHTAPQPIGRLGSVRR